MIRKISFIGAGNVATNLGVMLKNRGFVIEQVYSRTIKSANLLANMVDAEGISNIEDINEDVDIIILSVTDDVLLSVIKAVSELDAFVVHTSGSIDVEIFDNYFDDYGVLYPLQTFRKEIVDVSLQFPVFIEANNETNLEVIAKFASSITDDVIPVSSDDRKALHVAAVFSCNFVNHLYSIANDVISQSNISKNYLHPLINQTVVRSLENNPELLQTGPAIRNDEKIIKKHLKFLSYNKKYQKLYSEITKSIQEFHNT